MCLGIPVQVISIDGADARRSAKRVEEAHDARELYHRILAGEETIPDA